MRRLAVLILTLLAGLSLGSCDRKSSPTAGRLEVEGRAEVVTVEGDIRDVTGSRTLKSGEQVTLNEGTATLSLGEGRELELRQGAVVRLTVQTARTGQSEPRGELVTGDVLVVAPETTATILAADTEVQVNNGTAKVSRGLALVAAVYQGAAGVETGGREVSIPALRQVTVPAPGLPSRPTPLAFSASDPWDQRFLGDAIALGERLVATSRGFTDQLPPGEGRTVGFFQVLFPELSSAPGFNADLLDPERQAGETLVGAAITLEGTRGTFVERWENVFSFHDDGAPWGLVAMDQGVDRQDVLTAIDGAIARLVGAAAQAAPPPVTTAPATPRPPTAVPVVPTTPGGGGTAGSGSTGGTGGTGGTGAGGTGATGATGGTGSTGGGSTGTSGTDGTTRPATPDELGRGPLNIGIPLVDETVNNLVETLSGLLRAIGREE